MVEDSGDMHQKHYTILDEKRIKQLQIKDISEVSTCLSVSRSLACTLLCRNNWNTNSVFDQWFSDEENVRVAMGLLRRRRSQNPQNPPKTNSNLCRICFEEFEGNKNILSGPCGHPFCRKCWKTYIAVSIKDDGPGCLELRCPEPECKAHPGLKFVYSLTSNDDKDKYYNYLVRSYVEAHRNMKWCPGPGCDRVVQIDGSKNYYEVTCDCAYDFCWNCLEEPHHPVDCKTVDRWTEKNSSVLENNNTWIRAYTKPCPKCHRNIEKNEGCYHMTCSSPCGYQFCWLCLRKWGKKGHGTCDEYKEEEDRKNLEAPRENLKRYTLCYENWAWNHKSRETALDNLRQAKNGLIQKLADAQKVPEAKLQFVIEALEQIVESRRVLKWSFAYRYYLYGNGKIAYLSDLQSEVEAAVEKLQQSCDADNVIKKCTTGDFRLDDFQAKIVDLTEDTWICVDELVRALGNDVSDAETTRGCCDEFVDVLAALVGLAFIGFIIFLLFKLFQYFG